MLNVDQSEKMDVTGEHFVVYFKSYNSPRHCRLGMQVPRVKILTLKISFR